MDARLQIRRRNWIFLVTQLKLVDQEFVTKSGLGGQETRLTLVPAGRLRNGRSFWLHFGWIGVDHECYWGIEGWIMVLWKLGEVWKAEQERIGFRIARWVDSMRIVLRNLMRVSVWRGKVLMGIPRCAKPFRWLVCVKEPYESQLSHFAYCHQVEALWLGSY